MLCSRRATSTTPHNTMTNTELTLEQLKIANGAIFHHGHVCPMSSFTELSDISRNFKGAQKVKNIKRFNGFSQGQTSFSQGQTSLMEH